MSKKEIKGLSEAFVKAFDSKASRVEKHTVSEQTSVQILESKLSDVNRKINAARIGGVGNIGKLSEEKSRLQLELQELTKKQRDALASDKAKAQSKDKVSLKKAPWDMKEEIEELDENKAIIKLYQDMKAQGKKDHNILDYIGSMPKYKKVSRDQMAKMIGDAKRKGVFKEEAETLELHMSLLEAHGIEKKVAERVKKVFDGMSDADKAAFMKSYLKNPKAATEYMFKDMKKMAKEEVELDEGRMLEPAFHRVIKAHKYKSDASGKNYTWPQGDRSTKIKHNGTHVVTYNQHDGSKVHKTPASLNKHLNDLHDHEVDMKSLQESFELDEALDSVDPKAVKKKFDDRKDKDIDNDGDTDSSDEYLHKRRKAISKALAKEEVELDESWSMGVSSRNAHTHAKTAAQYRKKANLARDNAKLHDEGSSEHSKHMANYHSAQAKSIKSSYHAGDYGSSSEAKKDHKEHMAKSKEYRTAMKESVELDENVRKMSHGRLKFHMNNKSTPHGSYSWDQMKTERDRRLKTGEGEDYKKAKMSMSEGLEEAKDDYTINHKTFSSAVQHALENVKKRGYEVDDAEWDRKVAMGPRKPGKGKTNSYTIDLMKGGKETRRKLQMQVYYDEGRYELNMYIS